MTRAAHSKRARGASGGRSGGRTMTQTQNVGADIRDFFGRENSEFGIFGCEVVRKPEGPSRSCRGYWRISRKPGPITMRLGFSSAWPPPYGRRYMLPGRKRGGQHRHPARARSCPSGGKRMTAGWRRRSFSPLTGMSAHAQDGDVAAGHAFAGEACNACHMVEAKRKKTRDDRYRTGFPRYPPIPAA